MVYEVVSALAGELRARGVRVGVGEVLTAHRALEAVDAASPAVAHDALRACLCASRADTEAFEAAWAALLNVDGGRRIADPFADLRALERVPRRPVGVPPSGDEDRPDDVE